MHSGDKLYLFTFTKQMFNQDHIETLQNRSLVNSNDIDTNGNTDWWTKTK